MIPRSPRRRLAAAASGLVAGGVAGLGLLAAAGAAPDLGARASGDATQPAVLEAAHVPPLLALPGEAAELRYDVYCVPAAEESEEGCEVEGVVYARPGASGGFRAFPIELDPAAVEGRYVARLPGGLARSPTGFSYYAVLRERRSGATLTVPAGGALAPQRSLPLARPVNIDLGRHRFGAVRAADARVAQARWGDGPEEVGLEPGPVAQPMGGASFDVAPSGTVTLLDEAHRRALRWPAGAAHPEPVPLAINGTLADLAVAGDGSIHVLETTAGKEGAPVLRSFSGQGQPRAVVPLAERTAAQLRLGPEGPVALQYPSGQWMPLQRGAAPLAVAAQRAAGTSGRPHPGGKEVVVLRSGNELRLALVGRQGVLQAWRLRSSTPLAEVQLAEPLAGGLLVVVRVYEEDRDEFAVLLLGAQGLVRRFSVPSADWAETAPLSRFRLSGSSLYQLGSTSAGVFVDRYDLGVSS